MPLITRLLFLYLALACLTTASAQVYRWVDEYGVTVYSQHPPPSQEAEEIKLPPPASASTSSEPSPLDEKRQALEDAREDRELAKEQAAAKKEQEKLRKQNCAAAQHNLRGLESSPRRRWNFPDGSYRYLTEEERTEQLKQARDLVDKNCN